MVTALRRVVGKTTKGLVRAGILFSYLVASKHVKHLAGLSMLSEENLPRYSLSACPICYSRDYYPLVRMPFGHPDGQTHSLLYFDYASADMEPVLASKHKLDRYLGFVVSVPWSFCNNCKNGSLALDLTQEHLETYYSRYYERARSIHKYRRATKELHARFLCRFLKPGSRVLEMGAADGFAAEYVASQGHEVTVFEPSRNYHSRLETIFGITNISDPSTLPPESFDAVYLHHVFEHIASPTEYAKTLNQLLKPSGLLLIQVPDLSLQMLPYRKTLKRSAYILVNSPTVHTANIEYDFWSSRNSYPWIEALNNDHVSAFTPQGLAYVMEHSGFELEQLIQSTADRVTWDTANFAWPTDMDTGDQPNSLTGIFRKKRT